MILSDRLSQAYTGYDNLASESYHAKFIEI